MTTFYITGFIIALLFSLHDLAGELANNNTNKQDIAESIGGIVLISLFSWISVFAIVTIAVLLKLNGRR